MDLSGWKVLLHYVFTVRATEGGTVSSTFLFYVTHGFIFVVYYRRHKSILDYLHAQNLTKAFDALKAEASVDYAPDPKGKYAGLLEKKWTSVIRLQKKVHISTLYRE